MSSTIIIAGAGHAAGQVVATLCQKKYAGKIVLVGEESWLPYQRPPLSKKFLAGEMPAERLYVKPTAFYENAGVQVQLDTRIAKIDRHAKCVIDSAGRETGYDKLVLALGARVRRLDLPGVDLEGVHYLRNVQDVHGIRARMGRGRRICIVGAGYIGLEVAAVAAQLGMDVTVVELLDRVMKRVVSPELSAFYEREHRAHGVKLLLDTGLEAFVGDGELRGLLLADGTEIPADVAVIGIGIVPNTELAADAELPVNDGIVVDEYCRTEDPDIYAVGDCTFHPNPIVGRSIRLESVQNALEQARTAAAVISGEEVPYAQVPWFWSDQYDLKLQIAGLSQGYDETVLRGNPDSRSFSCAYLREGRMIAVDAVNHPKDFLQAKKVIADGGAVDRARLADPAIELKDAVEEPVP